MEESARKSSRARSIKKDASMLEADDVKSKKSEILSEARSKRSSVKQSERSVKNVDESIPQTVEAK